MSGIYSLVFVLKPLLICVYRLETMKQTFPIRTRVLFACVTWWLKNLFFSGIDAQWFSLPSVTWDLTSNILLHFCHRHRLLRPKVTIKSSSIITNYINSNRICLSFQVFHWKGQISVSFDSFSDILSGSYEESHSCGLFIYLLLNTWLVHYN